MAETAQTLAAAYSNVGQEDAESKSPFVAYLCLAEPLFACLQHFLIYLYT